MILTFCFSLIFISLLLCADPSIKNFLFKEKEVCSIFLLNEGI